MSALGPKADDCSSREFGPLVAAADIRLQTKLQTRCGAASTRLTNEDGVSENSKPTRTAS